MSNKKNVLEEANEIIFKRSEEKERDYGPIDESFEDTAAIASVLIGQPMTAEDCYKVMIALKMSRMKRAYKRDTYLDAIGYLGALTEMLDKKAKQDKLAEAIRIKEDKFNDEEL